MGWHTVIPDSPSAHPGRRAPACTSAIRLPRPPRPWPGCSPGQSASMAAVSRDPSKVPAQCERRSQMPSGRLQTQRQSCPHIQERACQPEGPQQQQYSTKAQTCSAWTVKRHLKSTNLLYITLVRNECTDFGVRTWPSSKSAFSVLKSDIQKDATHITESIRWETE